MTTTIGLSPSYYFGNNIDVVQNVSCHFEQSEKSRRVHWQSSCVRSLGASLCRDDTIDEILVLVDNCYIISFFYLTLIDRGSQLVGLRSKCSYANLFLCSSV